MTTPFVASLRARPDTIEMAPPGAAAITVRVQLAEAWDMVRVVVPSSETVLSVKLRALEALDPSAESPPQYVVTHRGVRILDESASLVASGIVNGATLLIANRHRRPVR